MRYLFQFFAFFSFLISCDNSTSQAQLKTSDIVGKKITFVIYDDSKYDIHYANGDYPHFFDFSFFSDGTVHKYIRSVTGNIGTIKLHWEIEENKLYINNGTRNTGANIRAPLVMEFTKSPADEVKVKWFRGIRPKLIMYRIFEIQSIPDSESIETNTILKEASFEGKRLLIDSKSQHWEFTFHRIPTIGDEIFYHAKIGDISENDGSYIIYKLSSIN